MQFNFMLHADVNQAVAYLSELVSLQGLAAFPAWRVYVPLNLFLDRMSLPILLW